MYKVQASESATCRTLFVQSNDGAWSVLVYDNSPTLREQLPESAVTVHDPGNGGLAAAYNRALQEAKLRGCDWLLLLDQDTELPQDFVQRLFVRMSELRGSQEIVAIVPRVEMDGTQLSPVLPQIIRNRPYTQGPGAESRWVSAINSGLAVRVGFMEAIGGFTSEFWLDFLDHWLFRRIQQCHAQVYINDVVVRHDLSIRNPGERMSSSRYRNFLAAERLFTNRYLPVIWRLALCGRLCVRAIKHLVSTPDKNFFWLTLDSWWTQSLWTIGIRGGAAD